MTECSKTQIRLTGLIWFFLGLYLHDVHSLRKPIMAADKKSSYLRTEIIILRFHRVMENIGLVLYFSSFYIINHISIIMLNPFRLVFLISEIKNCLTEGLEQPRGGTPALNAMTIRDQRHANVSKQRYWLTTLLRLTARTRSHDW